MRQKKDIQKVDIETYFSDVDDHVTSIQKPTSHYTQNDQNLSSLKKLLIAPPSTNNSVLRPYQNERSMLAEDRNFSVFELEMAYGAVCKLKDKLQTDSLEEVTPPPAPETEGIQVIDKPKPTWFLKVLKISVALTTIAILANISWPYATKCLTTKCYQSLEKQVSETVYSLGKRVSDGPSEIIEEMADSPDKGYFSESLRYAYTASQVTQHAQTSEDWQQVIHLWQLALKNLEYIPVNSTLYPGTQTKEVQYQNNLAYARRELEMAPFRAGVRAAEEASQLAIKADSEEEWQSVANKWQAALTMMQSVSSGNEHYQVAQNKLVEYSTKFAYTQKRYLDSQRP